MNCKQSWILLIALTCAIGYAHPQAHTLNIQEPEVVIVVVVDQLAHFYFKQLAPFLHDGLYEFSHYGVVYTNAHQPNGVPVTAVGHTNLGTGAVAKYHHVFDNDWVSSSGKKIDVFSKGLAAIPTLNKPFLANNKNNRALAISLKGRAVMGMAGDDAPKIWLGKTKFVTNAHQKSLTTLITQFNHNAPLLHPHAITWQRAYDDHRYYQQHNSTNYQYASEPSIIFGPQNKCLTTTEYFETLRKLPQANQMILDLAIKYLQTLCKKHHGHILLWLSLSTLDKVGHLYGPDSTEAIDTIYHLDQQLGAFMKTVSALTHNKTLYVLTADHGVMPIPELLKEKYPTAQRIMIQPLQTKLNQLIAQKFAINNAITSIEVPFVYFNQRTLKLTKKQYASLIAFVIEQLKNTSGIANAYETSLLAKKQTIEGSLEWFLQNNIVLGRSGQITLLLDEYTQLTKHSRGTTHQSPYDFNTHVPLMLYWPEYLEHKTITQRVWVPQLHATLAKILGITPASLYAMQPLPGLFNTLTPIKPIGSTAQIDQPLASCIQSAIAHA